jgi:succinate-acetate transporter protein
MEVNMNETTWANPAPAGLVALSIACFGFFALLSGLVNPSAMPLLGLWLIGGFVVQIVVAIIDLKLGNTTGGNTFLFFSAFFMLVGGLGMLLKYDMTQNGIPFDSRIDGYAWIVLTISLLLWTPAFLKGTLIPIVIMLDFSLPFITLIDLGLIEKTLSYIPAYSLLVVGIYAMYVAAAIVVNESFGKTVYPIFKIKNEL